MDSGKLKTFIGPAMEIAMEEHRRSLSTEPFPRRARNRDSSIMQHMENHRLNMNKKHIIRAHCITPQQRHSDKELSDLASMRPIRLCDMQVNFVHEGRCLVCRTVVPAYYETALITLVEDCDGEVEMLQLYNFARSFDVDANKLLPEGTVLIIKEPFIKLSGKSGVEKEAVNGIHVDSPSDVIEVHAGMSTGGLLDVDVQQLYPKARATFDELKAEGNKRFVNKEYEEAIRYYTKALNEKPDAVVLANRAAAYLALDQFWPAHKDAKASAELDPTNLKSYFRAGKAAYGMRQWDDAVEWFTKCLNIDKSNADVKRELARSQARLLESTTGSYDLIAIYDQFKAGKEYFDVADYQSPDIDVKDINGKGKGVVALKDIKKGTLLVCSKAAVWATDEMSMENLVIADVASKTLKELKPCDGLNRPRLIYMMRFNPYLADSVYSLYAGEEHQRPFKKVNGDHVLIDVARLDAIKAMNEFESESAFDQSNSGLWIYPSFFNHSCLPNATRDMLGDLVFIYALCDIPKDKEITISYVNFTRTYEKRMEILQPFNFKCDCELCETDMNDEKRFLRERLISDFMDDLPSNMTINNALSKLKSLESQVAQIRQTYLKRPNLQFRMYFPLNALVDVYFGLGDYKNSERLLLDLFAIFSNGYTTSNAKSVALEIASCKRGMSKFKESDEWLKRVIDINCVGDEAYFKHCNKQYFLEAINLNKIDFKNLLIQ